MIDPAPSATGAPSALASLSAPPSSASLPPPPDHWSTRERDPAAFATLAAARGGDFFLAATVVSEDGAEGDVYLEQRGADLVGAWGETFVTGTSGSGGSVVLRDAVTKETIFTGTWSGGALAGTLRAEGEERAVRSLPPRELSTLSERIEVHDPRGSLVVELAKGAVTSASAKRFGPTRTLPVRATVSPDGGSLAITDDVGSWSLHRTASGLVGRSPAGTILRGAFSAPTDTVALPFRSDGFQLSSQHLKRGARGSRCEIDVELATLRGTPADATIQTTLRREAMDAAAGFQPSGEPPPTAASFTCAVDPAVTLQIQSAQLSLSPLSAGFLGVLVSGYARFSDMGGVSTPNHCLMIDTRRGVLIPDVLATLPDVAREAVRRHVERSLRREQRALHLTIDDFYTSDGLPSLEGTTACVTSRGLRVLVPLGLITKSLPTGPLVAEVPAEVVTKMLPPEHALREAMSGSAPR